MPPSAALLREPEDVRVDAVAFSQLVSLVRLAHRNALPRAVHGLLVESLDAEVARAAARDIIEHLGRLDEVEHPLARQVLPYRDGPLG